MRTWKVVLMVGLVLASCGTASALDLLFDQIGVLGVPGSPTDALVGDTRNNVSVADNFSLTSDSTLQQVIINGYFDSMGLASLSGFNVKIYGDDGGVPGTELASRSVGIGNVTVNGNNYTIPVADIALSGSTTYWLGIQASLGGMLGEFRMCSANDEATGPGSTYVSNLPGASTVGSGLNKGRYWHNDGTGYYTWYKGTYSGSFPPEWSTGNNSYPQALDMSFSLSGLGEPPPPAPTGTWAGNTSGIWTDSSKWTGTVPMNADDWAKLGDAIQQPRVIATDVPITLGKLTFDNASSYTIAGALDPTGTVKLTMDKTGGGAEIEILQGDHYITMPVEFVGDSIINVTSGSLTTLDSVTVATGSTLTIAGNGNVTMAGSPLAGLVIEAGGTVVLAANLGSAAGAASASATAVPEPGTLVLLAAGALALALGILRRR